MMARRVAYVLCVFPKISETFVASELADVRRRGPEVHILSLRRPAEDLRAATPQAAIPSLSLGSTAAVALHDHPTTVGGIPDLIDDGVTGFLRTPDDAGRLAGALERLLRDPDLVARFGAAARLRAEEHFSTTRQVDRLLSAWRGPVGHDER